MKNKVVLFHGNAKAFQKDTPLAPLALLHISSFLVKDGFKVKIFSDVLCNNYIEEAVKECHDSICFGITAMTGNQIYEGLKVAGFVRQRYPDLPIIWGGWHPSIMPKSTLEDPYVDFIIIGQGERKFYDLVKRLRDNGTKNLQDIPGIGYKNDGGLILQENCAIEDMNNFPTVPYEIIDLEKCLFHTEFGNRVIQYISSYGCTFRCSFCIDPVVNKRRWTGLSADRVLEEWSYYHKKYEIDGVTVFDNNFFVDKKRVINLCEGLLRKNLKLKWGNVNGRISQMVRYEEEIWNLMRKAGLAMLVTGSESGEQDVLDLIQKDSRVEDVYKFTELTQKYGIKTFFSYMSGMPWSDNPKFNKQNVDREIRSIVSQVSRLSKINKKTRFMLYAYTPLPGSELYRRAIRYGFEEPKSLHEWGELLYSPEDVFQKVGFRRRWLTYKQFRLITMLEQYIFGMLDLDARDHIAQNIKNSFFRKIFKLSFNLGNLIVRLRLKLKFFAFPVDYWLFVQFRKKVKFV
ncbi:MAG: radical SAM protein [Candidatus Omnitrophota bacterium]|nr:radical SAM protein [Candidatus Omnitrophota bacterium]